MRLPITEHVVRSARHTTAYLACGATDAPPIVFVHGWPELAISWRHQLRCFADLGFRAIAPDMRGYGRSSVPTRTEDYALEEAVADMLELLAALGHESAIWVGHDWGTPVVWSLASHHAGRCRGVAGLCVPYLPGGFVLDALIARVDRRVYPAAEFPAGQWEYMRFYESDFERACRALEADPVATVKALMRAGSPATRGKPARTAFVRRDGGWFGGADRAPDVPRDPAVLTEEDLHAYASALARNGFAGPGAWYMNHARNADYARRAPDAGRLAMPVLFLHGRDDTTCETVDSTLAEPMRLHCTNLTERIVASGHWMAQERPVEVNAALAQWLARSFPTLW